MVLLFCNKYMLHRGSVENYIVVGDLEGLNVFNIPYSLLSNAFNYILSINKGKSRGTFCVNAPSTFSYIWATAQHFMDESTVKKAQIVDGPICPALLQLVEPE